MAEMRATPYSNPFLGGVSGLVDALTGWMQDPNRTQQMQSVGGFIQDSGIPKTLQRMAYGEPITNVNQANVPLLKPETGNAALTLLGALPVGAPAAKMLPKNIPVGMSIKPIGDVIPPMMPKAPVSPAGFYSAAEQAALNLQRSKGQGQAFINDLMKSPEVKKEELQYTGLLDAFANKPQASKQELVDYLQAKRTNLGEIVKRDVQDMDFEDLRSAYIKQTGWDIPESWDSSDVIDALDDNATAKFLDYTIPDGKNNREILLTLPSNETAEKALQRFEAEMAQKYTSEGAMWPRVGTYDDLAKRNELMQAFKSRPPEYYGGHWDEPNVLAHVRVNDRLDSDGKRMTLIEEVQSDWHQAGRTRGYNQAENEVLQEKATANYENIAADAYQQIIDIRPDLAGRPASEVINLARTGPYGDKQNVIDLNTRQLLEPLIEQVDAAKKKQAEVRMGPVSDVPMKDTWYQTALRKAVKDAIDQGSDRVGITTGATQIERYPDESNVKGMKKYYDDIYPKYLDKFAKKYGSSVKEGGIPFGDQYNLASLDNGKTFRVYETETNAFLPKVFKTQADAEEFLKTVNKTKVRYIEITPEMRKAFGGKDKGVPLFQAAPLIPVGIGAGGLLDQFGERQQ